MAKSSLTPKQWKEIERRYLPPNNETGRELEREFGVSEAAIRKRFGSQKKQINIVANQMVAAEQNLKKLDISSQVRTLEYKDLLMSISSHMLKAANYAASTAHKATMFANMAMDCVDETEPMTEEKNMTRLKDALGLTKIANEASVIPLNLLNANKEKLAGEQEENVVQVIGGFDV